jgi:hypothetical protein
MTHDPPLFVRHPEQPSGIVVGYYSIVGQDNCVVATHLYQQESESDARTDAQRCSDRHPGSHVNYYNQTTRTVERVYDSRPVKHDIRPGVWDGPVGTTVTVRGPCGTYVQEER